MTIAPREKLRVVRAFSEPVIVDRTSGVHPQDGECGEKVMSRLWHILEKSEPGEWLAMLAERSGLRRTRFHR